MITIKRLTYVCSVLICSISYVAIAMDNPPTVSLLAFPTVVDYQDRQQFEKRYKHILQQNMTRLSIGLPHEPERREMMVYNYEHHMLNQLEDLLHQQRPRSSLSTTMTNANAVRPSR